MIFLAEYGKYDVQPPPLGSAAWIVQELTRLCINAGRTLGFAASLVEERDELPLPCRRKAY